MKRILQKKLVVFILILCLGLFSNQVYASEQDTEGTAYAFTLDVSGSMKSADRNEITVSLLKLFIDSLTENDYVSVTAYNDSIVFNSNIISVKDRKAIEELKQQLEQLEFSGDTDNGLGLLTATKNIADADISVKNKCVLLISDGDTDLPKETDRTIEESDADLDLSEDISKENGIVLHAIEYTDQYMQDTSKLSVVTSATGGSTKLVNDEEQFALVMMNTFYASCGDCKMDFQIAALDDVLGENTFSMKETDSYDYLSIVFSPGGFRNTQVFSDQSGNKDALVTDSYMIIKSDRMKDEEVTARYTLQQPGNLIFGTVQTGYENEPEESVVESIEETTQIDLEPTKPPVPEKQEADSLTWIKDVGMIGIIALITLLLCIVIIRKMLFHKKEQPAIEGFLHLSFIDLKSKNESRDIEWDLSQYPKAGVTLMELFRGSRLEEDLNDLDKICFYPSNKKGELIFVYCMNGSVFKGDTLVKKNTSNSLREGEILYISFEENSSELTIQYRRA